MFRVVYFIIARHWTLMGIAIMKNSSFNHHHHLTVTQQTKFKSKLSKYPFVEMYTMCVMTDPPFGQQDGGSDEYEWQAGDRLGVSSSDEGFDLYIISVQELCNINSQLKCPDISRHLTHNYDKFKQTQQETKEYFRQSNHFKYE